MAEDDMELIGHFFKVWTVQFFSVIFWLLDVILDILFGVTLTRGSMSEREESKSYEKCANKARVLKQANHFSFIQYDLSKVLHYHLGYVHPDIVKQDNVCLWFITRKEAVFAVSEEDNSFYSVKRFPFFFGSFPSLTKDIIIIPLEHFHKLAKNIGDPKGKLAFVNMSSRCGSTLLCQAMDRLPYCRSIAEPNAFIDVNHFYQMGYISAEENKKLTQSLVRVYSKHSRSQEINLWFYKMTPHGGNSEVPVIKSLYPNSHVILNTRHPHPSIKSSRKVHNALRESVSGKLGYWWRHQITGSCEKALARPFFGLFSPWRNFGFGPFCLAEIAAFQYGFSLTVFLANKESHDSVILYEDLIKNPRGSLAMLFDNLGLPESDIPIAAEAFGHDSGSYGRGDWDQAKGDRATTWEKDADRVFEALDLPIRCGMSEQEFRNIIVRKKSKENN